MTLPYETLVKNTREHNICFCVLQKLFIKTFTELYVPCLKTEICYSYNRGNNAEFMLQEISLLRQYSQE